MKQISLCIVLFPLVPDVPVRHFLCLDYSTALRLKSLSRHDGGTETESLRPKDNKQPRVPLKRPPTNAVSRQNRMTKALRF